MKVNVITGGNGFLGKHLVLKLLNQGEYVVLIIRSHKNNSAQQKTEKIFPNYKEYLERFSFFEGDVTQHNLGLDEKSLQFFNNKNIVFWHIAANLSFRTTEKDEQKVINVDGTRNVVDFVNQYARRFFYISTVYVSGKTSELIMEDILIENPVLRNNYEETKYMAEKIVRDNCRVATTIIRPSIILGDAYEGKAQGCTFGYYRFAYIFFIFRNWIIKSMQENGIKYFLFKLVGTQYSAKSKILNLPWLVLPYPKNACINIIPIDYTIETILSLLKNEDSIGKTFHLVHNNPPRYIYLFKVLLEDLGYRNVKHIEVPRLLFLILFKLFYACVPFWRKYFNSALWYMPYITEDYNFSQKNVTQLYIELPPNINREYLMKVNKYAEGEIFSKIII